VGVNYVTAKRLLSTDTAVVRALHTHKVEIGKVTLQQSTYHQIQSIKRRNEMYLRTGEPTNGPAERPVDILLQEGVLLLNTVPIIARTARSVSQLLSQNSYTILSIVFVEKFFQVLG
jgi:hypothetical protein